MTRLSLAEKLTRFHMTMLGVKPAAEPTPLPPDVVLSSSGIPYYRDNHGVALRHVKGFTDVHAASGG